MEISTIRKFEIPYNFDFNLIRGLQILNLINESIKYIYISPYVEDYVGVQRHDPNGANEFTRETYVTHINFVKQFFEGRMQLLLQKKNQIMPIETLKWYIDLGFTAFCCGNIEQAKIIKEYDSNLQTIGSIVMHTTRTKLIENPDYFKYFDEMVLDFSYGKDIQEIKILPPQMKYMILINALCNVNCIGDHHWFCDPYAPVNCPGKIIDEGGNFYNSCLIRPMDLQYFDPYISTYKFGDRSWLTREILRDIVLYTTDFSIYPGITYEEDLYELGSHNGD